MEALFATLTFGFMIAWLALGISATWASNNIFFQFRKRYPEEARARIPHAFTGLRHPKKVLYFLSKKSKIFLEEQNDSELLNKRMFLMKSLYSFLSLHLGAMLLGLTVIVFVRFIK